VGQQKSTEEGRCVATGLHATIKGTVVFFLVRSGATIRQRFLWGPFPGYIARAVQRRAVAEPPSGPTIVGTGNGTPEVPELPSAWGYS
jgi:hypothetical protein